MKAEDQKIKMGGKPVKSPIPANQQAARDLRAKKRDEQRPRSAGTVVKEAVGGWLRRGANNFLENANRPVIERREREPRREGKGRGRPERRQEREEHNPFNIPTDFAFNPDALRMAEMDLDFNQHPDPMYHGVSQNRRAGKRRGGRGDREGAKSVTVTTRRYEY